MSKTQRGECRGINLPSLLMPLSLALLLAAIGCGSDDGAAEAAEPVTPECVQVRLASVLLERDNECTVATHPLTLSKLPDLQFSPEAGLCFVVGPAQIEFISLSGEAVSGLATAYSGIVSNPIAAEAIEAIAQPCDAERPVLVFTAATVAELTTSSGDPVGELVMRDTGWAEIDPATAFPGFVSERLVVTGGRRGVFEEVSGELLLTGDEFSGVPAAGSLCGPELFDRLRALFG